MEGEPEIFGDVGSRNITQRHDIKQFIDGKFMDSQSSHSFVLHNPSTGKRSVEMPLGCGEDADAAVTSSRKAFEHGCWSNLPPSKRQEILHEFARLIEMNDKELNTLDALDMGKPVGLEFGGAISAAGLLRYYANAIDNLAGDVYNSDITTLIVERLLPRGVVGAIVPWNFPTLSALTKIAPALAAGNSIVLKPSESSPRSAAKLAYLATEAGIPPGVLNLVQGKGETVGRALALSDLVDMITFTGSTNVGKLMLQYAGESNLKLIHAECGGKSPHIVFPDFNDLDAVADNIVHLISLNQGQLCVTGSRVLVHKEIETELTNKLSDRMREVVQGVGDPLDQKTTYGPLANQIQLNKVLSYISAAKETTELVCGGRLLLEDSGGYFLEPTLFANVSPLSEIAQEEIFGPVLSVTSFETVEEAIQLANATKYGLSAYVWTTSLATGMRLSREIRVGMVNINNHLPIGEGAVSAATEPYGMSGVGVEYGMAGLAAYTRRQVAWFNHG